MDADGLPIVGPGVDYTKVESISQKRTIAFLNHFVSHTASFLNRFSCVCEEKLEHMSNRLQQLEITMNLLDAKISSIPGMENVTAASSSTGTSSQAAPADSTAPPAPAAPGAPPPPVQEESAPPPVQEEPQVTNPVSKDPRYMKYFKLVQVGVPEQVVKMKMTTEGLDPDMLDNPDAPAPPGGQQKDDDFGDKTDSDETDDSDDFD